jgi:hypothetical protein
VWYFSSNIDGTLLERHVNHLIELIMAPASLSIESWILILVALMAANAAYTSPKFLFFKTLEDKHVGWCLLEMGIWYALIGLIGYSLESMIGNVFPKRWEFFAVSLCLFLVAAFPGFTWRFLMKHRHDPRG